MYLHCQGIQTLYTRAIPSNHHFTQFYREIYIQCSQLVLTLASPISLVVWNSFSIRFPRKSSWEQYSPRTCMFKQVSLWPLHLKAPCQLVHARLWQQSNTGGTGKAREADGTRSSLSTHPGTGGPLTAVGVTAPRGPPGSSAHANCQQPRVRSADCATSCGAGCSLLGRGGGRLCCVLSPSLSPLRGVAANSSYEIFPFLSPDGQQASVSCQIANVLGALVRVCSPEVADVLG